MMASILAFTTPTLPLLHNYKPHFLATRFSQSQICYAFSPENPNPISEEARWLREEQRWLREEQRWLREESRWNAERQALLQQITTLDLRIQDLQRLNSSQGASTVAKLIQVLKDGDLGKNINRIAESGSSATPFVVEAAEEEEVVVKEVISIPDKKESVKKKKETLRKGSEGDEVGAMQEALLKLGFYSGEEDMEFSSFSSGTERAIKTWQASLGLPEDGIMTAALLERLFGTKNQETDPLPDLIMPIFALFSLWLLLQFFLLPSQWPKLRANGAPIASIADMTDIQQTILTEEVEESHDRVFLLGENRWEEPSRLSGGSKSKSTVKKATTNCLTCRGEGRVLCMECDGTGEPNVEPQFMEWVDEGAKCPYCEGVGFITCDVCGGTPVTNS